MSRVGVGFSRDLAGRGPERTAPGVRARRRLVRAARRARLARAAAVHAALGGRA